ncbi:UBX domain-containing protein 4, partial [Massospora cicadina]
VEFDPSVQLGNVREKLEGMVGSIAGAYAFVLGYPRKRFSKEDESKTLLELGLCPSNSLIVE